MDDYANLLGYSHKDYLIKREEIRLKLEAYIAQEDNEPVVEKNDIDENIECLIDSINDKLDRAILSQLINAAESGNKESAFELGQLYESQNHFRKAAMIYKKLAEEGLAAAQYKLGWMYNEGIVYKRNLKKAVSWIQKSADQEYPEAQYELAQCYKKGIVVEANPQKAMDLYRAAALQGCVEAQLDLGLWLINEDEFEPEGERWLQKAAENRNMDAMFYLGDLYSNGFNGKKDLMIAAYCYHEAAKSGNPEAQYKFGDCCISGKGLEKNVKRGLKYMLKAAANGNMEAQYQIGCMYYYGYNVDKNSEEAFKWLSKASEQSYGDAQTLLGRMYLNGEAVEKDINKAMELFSSAINGVEECTNAMVELGKIYSMENFPRRDLKKSFYLIEKAAKEGNAEAIFLLGQKFIKGEGVEKNTLMGFRFVLNAAFSKCKGANEYLNRYN